MERDHSRAAGKVFAFVIAEKRPEKWNGERSQFQRPSAALAVPVRQRQCYLIRPELLLSMEPERTGGTGRNHAGALRGCFDGWLFQREQPNW